MHSDAGPRAHQVEMRLRGADDRAGGRGWCRRLPVINPPITKHRQWALGAVEAGAESQRVKTMMLLLLERSAGVESNAGRAAGRCRYQRGMQTIRRNLQCVQSAWNRSVQPDGASREL